MRSIVLLAAGLAAATVSLVAGGDPTSEAPPSGVSRPARYQPPLRRPVADPFRAPAHRYGPGNRGLEYESVRGDVVGAIGSGVVTFAGSVAGTRVVTVLHPDGLRSSSVGLVEVGVAVGARVAVGDPLGRAGPHFHLGVRRGDGTYLDPASLFERRAVLVPDQTPGAR